MRETLYPQVRLNLYVIEKKARSMSTKEQKGGQALSYQTRLFGSLKQLQQKNKIKPLATNKMDRQNSLNQTEMCRNLGS